MPVSIPTVLCLDQRLPGRLHYQQLPLLRHINCLQQLLGPVLPGQSAPLPALHRQLLILPQQSELQHLSRWVLLQLLGSLVPAMQSELFEMFVEFMFLLHCRVLSLSADLLSLREHDD